MNTRTCCLVAAAAAAAFVLAGCSSDTSLVSVEEQGAGTRDAGIAVDLDGPVTVTFREITLEPGGTTGKHCHDGNLIAVVVQGELTHYAPIYRSGVHVYEAGDAILEGPGYVHEGVNEGTEPVILEVTYLIPEGDPLAETDLSLCYPEGEAFEP